MGWEFDLWWQKRDRLKFSVREAIQLHKIAWNYRLCSLTVASLFVAGSLTVKLPPSALILVGLFLFNACVTIWGIYANRLVEVSQGGGYNEQPVSIWRCVRSTNLLDLRSSCEWTKEKCSCLKINISKKYYRTSRFAGCLYRPPSGSRLNLSAVELHR